MYVYKVMTDIFAYGKFSNWQDALDARSEFLSIRDEKVINTDIWIDVYNDTEFKFSLRKESEIKDHSKFLMELENVNRVEGRIMKEQYDSGFDIINQNSKAIVVMEDDPNFPTFKEDHEEEYNSTMSKVDFHGDFDKMTAEQQDAIINPKHYKMLSPEAIAKHPQGMEYIDLMAFLLEDHSGVQAHLLGQIYKYSMRLGKKDNKLQDARKIEWYAARLAKTVEEDKS